ncbi:alpha/beta fold hydrolase [Sphingomonas flavalba]|uniref:alpha/beta fold hydrolase n=1 Tax=Sphingomonas flavalba TaxID=2559804 RepID=UPI0039DFF34D
MTPPYRSRRYRSADGRLTLFARDYPGDGAPLLLMHGLTRNSADFEPLARHLAGRHRLIVPDQRGRGLSDPDPQPANYRPDIYTLDMWALLDGLGIDRIGLIGTSMGGLMAMIMAAVHRDRVSLIVLNDVGPELMPEGLERIRGYTGGQAPTADWTAAAGRCAAINGAAFPDFTVADWAAFARRTCTELADGRVAFAYDPAVGAAMQTAAVQQDLWPLWDSLGTVPTLLLRGALSDVLAAATADNMARRHTGAFSRVDIARRGHAPLLDEPEAIAAIEAFLARHG